MEKWPKVSIIILNWNSWQDTIECLKSIKNINYKNLEVIIIDNASYDISPEKIIYWCIQSNIPYERRILKIENMVIKTICIQKDHINCDCAIENLVLLELNKNVGFCKGNNIAMEQAIANGADFLLILNNDTIVTPNFLKPMVEVAEKQNDAGLVGGIICYANRRDMIWFAGGTFNSYLKTHRSLESHSISEINPSEVIESEKISGCMMLIPKNVYINIGGFDEEYFIWSEDWDYSLRIKKAGYRMYVVSDALIYHKVGRSLGVMKSLSYYYGTRNSLLLRKKHLSPAKRILFLFFFILSRIIRYSWFGVNGRWDLVYAGCVAIRDYFLRRTGKWKSHRN